jgi:hypothetical protein
VDFSPIQLVIFILVFVPGYIFIHITDYHLLKGEKSQFEKTVQVLLASTVIWVVMVILPCVPFITQKKTLVINYIISAIDKKPNALSDIDKQQLINTALWVYIAVLVYTFVAANIYGWLRRFNRIDFCIKSFTGRDRYKTVSLRFYTENLGSTVAVTNGEGKKFVGILGGAPDSTEDNAIILYNPSVIEGSEFLELSTTVMLLYVSDITRLEVIKNIKEQKNG